MTRPNVSKLVERQMRNWELARSQRPAAAETRRPVEDFVAVSRMVGVDATPVVTRLAERLGWPYFDKQILDEMSGKDFFRLQVYASMDQRDLSWWEEAMRAFTESTFVKNDYFHQLCRTVLSLARQGNAIFVGRGTDLILPQGMGLRVRLVASEPVRLRHLGELRGLADDDARRELGRIERERQDFFQRHFQVDATDPSRHDLVLHLERFAPDRAVDIIMAARAGQSIS